MALDRSKPSPTVAQLRSLKQAGNSLSLGYLPIPRFIRRLARELETRLFEGLGGKICLTEKGERLLQAAAELVDKVKASKKKAPS